MAGAREGRSSVLADLVETQKAVIDWAQSKCPCYEETPDPCPLCGATVDAGTCKAVESIFPRTLLHNLRAALARAGDA